MLVASPTPNATAATTAGVAASTVRRRGLAASVVRIVPVLYSDVIARTASATSAISPNQIPVRPFSTTSVSGPSWLLPRVSDSQLARALNRTEISTSVSSDQTVLRT